MMASEILILIGSIVISTLKGPESLSERLIRDSGKEYLELDLGEIEISNLITLKVEILELE